MISVQKPLGPKDIPLTLRLPAEAPKSEKARMTDKRRAEFLKDLSKVFPKNDKEYTKHYKRTDTKRALRKLYNNKCAYCEQRTEFLEVEHYRPTILYPWLAYSWDNLLLSCKGCNATKKNRFEILGRKVMCDPSRHKNIHGLTVEYQASERPLLLNPEYISTEDLKSHFSFNSDGEICATTDEGIHTIKHCDLNRNFLTTGRKEILDNFEKDLYFEANDVASEVKFEIGLANRRKKATTLFLERCATARKKFQAEVEATQKPFLAFRAYSYSHLLEDIEKKVYRALLAKIKPD